jgi:phage repressor protein C with HTH and peptisase S24 domain
MGFLDSRDRSGGRRTVPLIGLAQAGAGGFFDDGGFPTGGGWDEVAFPEVPDPNAYALEISGESMLPLYRDGDIVIVSPNASVRRGDRVVLKTREGEVLAKELKRRTENIIELKSLNPEHPDRTIPLDKVAWLARIIWSSQ